MSEYHRLSEDERQSIDDWIAAYRQRCVEAGHVGVLSGEWLNFARETLAHPRNAKSRAAYLERWRINNGRRE